MTCSVLYSLSVPVALVIMLKYIAVLFTGYVSNHTMIY